MATIRVSPEELRALATKCKAEGGNIARVQQNVTSAVRGTNWESPAATRFKSDWDTKYTKALNELAAALDQLGVAANQMAANYDQTEAAYKGS